MLLASAINNILLLDANNGSKVDKQIQGINEMLKRLTNTGNDLMLVEKPQDLTLILDLYSDEGKHNAKATLYTNTDRREPDNLLTKKEIGFILALVDGYSQSMKCKIGGSRERIVILPGTVLLSELPECAPSHDTMPRTEEDEDSIDVSPAEHDLTSFSRIEKQHRCHKGDYTYIIGHRIKKHLKYSTKKFVVFSKKNNSIITNIRIIVDSTLREDRFRQKR